MREPTPREPTPREPTPRERKPASTNSRHAARVLCPTHSCNLVLKNAAAFSCSGSALPVAYAWNQCLNGFLAAFFGAPQQEALIVKVMHHAPTHTFVLAPACFY